MINVPDHLVVVWTLSAVNNNCKFMIFWAHNKFKSGGIFYIYFILLAISRHPFESVIDPAMIAILNHQMRTI